MICGGCGEKVTRARYIQQADKWVGKCCDPGSHADKRIPGSMFPFTTTNLGKDPSKPITVKSLSHLRRLERENGVQSVAFNMNESNWGRSPEGREQPR